MTREKARDAARLLASLALTSLPPAEVRRFVEDRGLWPEFDALMRWLLAGLPAPPARPSPSPAPEAAS